MFDRNLMKFDGMGPVMGALLVLALLQAAAIIGQTLGLTDAAVALWQGADIADAAPSIAAFAACFALLHLLRMGQETMLDSFSRKSAAKLRERVVEATFDGRTMLASTTGAASVATAATDGIDEIQTYVRIIPPKVIGMVALSIPLLVAVFVLDWISGVILAIMFPVIIFFMVLLGRQASDRAARQYASYTRLSNRFMDTLRGLPVVKAFGAEKREANATFEQSEKLRRATIRTLTTASLSSAVLDLCATFGVAAVAIMLAFRLMDGSLSLATALAALVLAPEYFSPIRSFASDFHASLDGKNALAAVLNMLEAPHGATGAVDDDPGNGELIEWTGQSTLSLDGISLVHADGTAALRDVTLELHGFEKVAIVGKSGAGKTTLASIVSGFAAPTSGTISIDGKPVDLRSDGWKRCVRYIPQNPYIFRASLRDNVRFYHPTATDEQVRAAIEAVGLADLVAQLPDGIDTVVGEGARGLSGGQAHRVALARVLLDDKARVLVFDEPTAHLDIETELDLKREMLGCMEGKLVLLATHRLHWTADMDRVIVLESGTVAKEEGRTKATSPVVSSGEAPDSTTNASSSAATTGEPIGAPASSTSSKQEKPPQSTPGIDPLLRTGRFPAWFRGFLSRFKRSVVIAVVLGLVASGCSALLMFASGYLIGATAQPGITLFAIMVPVAFVQIFGLGRPIARYLERLVSHDWVLKVTSHLRLALYWGIERRMGDPSLRRATGEYLSLLSDDIAHLQNLYLRVAFPTAIALLLAIGAALLFGFFSIGFALAMLAVFALVALLLPFATLRATRPLTASAKALRAEEATALTDNVMGATDWVLAGHGSNAAALHARSDAHIRDVEAKVRMVERTVALVTALVLGGAACLVIAWAGTSFGGDTATQNWSIAFALGFFPLIEAFATLPSALSQVPVHEDSLDRLDEYMESAPEADASHDETLEAGSRAADASPSEGSAPVEAMSDIAHASSAHEPPDEPAISIEDLCYTYPGAGMPALRGVTMDITAGTKVALLGRSGSGKSTLAEIVRGMLAPDQGTVRACAAPVIGADGSPTHLIGYLGQTPYLFNRTLRENLTLGVFDVADARLIAILESVGLGERFARLADGLDTVIGETGVGLSGGEAHRVALARTIVADAPIVIVDEPFSALDPETERALLDTMFAACQDKTLLVITHHLAEADRFDRIVFIEDGAIELDGSPAQLREKSARFRQLVEFDRNW